MFEREAHKGTVSFREAAPERVQIACQDLGQLVFMAGCLWCRAALSAKRSRAIQKVASHSWNMRSLATLRPKQPAAERALGENVEGRGPQAQGRAAGLIPALRDRRTREGRKTRSARRALHFVIHFATNGGGWNSDDAWGGERVIARSSIEVGVAPLQVPLMR